MQKTITPGQISQNNLRLIYHLIYKHGRITQQDMSYDLRLSRPTIASKLSELETQGLIRKDGQTATDQVGRKAAAYSIIPDYRVAIGTEILEDQVKLIMVDLYGNYSHRTVKKILFKNNDEYARHLCDLIKDYIAELPVSDDQVLGIGFSLPGLVSPDGATVTYGKILDCTNMSVNTFAQYMNYPCRFLHDADAAAGSELWVSQDLKDFMYLMISMHFGASIIHDRTFMASMHGHSATVEHIPIRAKGKLCYCGKKGCIETLCSMKALLQEDKEDDFFRKLRTGDPDIIKRWNRFLKNLAETINTLHLVYDTIYVLGGYLASHLIDEDIEILYRELERLSPFPENRDFLRVSKLPKHNITIGAALPFILEFLNGDVLPLLETDVIPQASGS